MVVSIVCKNTVLRCARLPLKVFYIQLFKLGGLLFYTRNSIFLYTIYFRARTRLKDPARPSARNDRIYLYNISSCIQALLWHSNKATIISPQKVHPI